MLKPPAWYWPAPAANPQITQITQIIFRDEKTYKLIGAAIEVHKELGCGFLEAVYQEALEKEFRIQDIPFKLQPIIEIRYKGQLLEKKYQPDFICFGEIIVEIKAISSLSGVAEAQLINYLKGTELDVGLLINFGSKSLEYKRFVYNLRESALSADHFRSRQFRAICPRFSITPFSSKPVLLKSK